MDLKAIGIMNEVDELLGKLDKLPDKVRIEILKKLSQKVSTSASKLKAAKKNKSQPREAAVHNSVSAVPRISEEKILVKVEVKEEPVEEKTCSSANVDQQTNAMGVQSASKKPKKTLPERVVSGRRQTKKVDYKQLSEYGLDEGDEENIASYDDDVGKVRPFTKRGRGRPKKNLGGGSVVTSVAQSDTKEAASSVTEENIVAGNEMKKQVEKSIVEGYFDLLESCLKESGIKAAGERADEQEKENGNEPGKQSLEEDNEEEQKNSPKKVFVFNSLESINNVRKKKSGTSKFKCDECGKMYSSLSVLKTHQIRHRKKEDLPFACKHCDFKSASKIELFRHSLKHEKSLVYACNICEKQFSRDTGLREHIHYIHAKSQVLKCGICQFSTHRRSTMRNHLQTHQGTTPVIACPVCGVTFRSKTNLRTHLFSHAGLKRFECDECDKKFISRNRVKAHKLYVHGPREHNCPYCEMKFPIRHALNRHILVHTGEKPFQCCFCAFTCNTQGNLIKHIRHVHEKINFTYKDFLRESRKEDSTSKVDSVNMERMQKEGKDFAFKVFNTIGESTGETLTLEQLKEEVQKKKESKVAALQEQQSKKRRKILKKAVLNSGGKDKKITVYSVPEKSGDAVTKSPLDDNVYVEGALSGLGDDNSCWLTHTDENGCVMLIPWDVSLIGENDEGEEEDEIGEWRQDLQVDKIVKIASTSGNIPVNTPKAEDISIEKFGEDCGVESLESSFEIGNNIKRNKKPKNEVRNDIFEVGDLCEIVDNVNPLVGDVTDGTPRSENLSQDKKVYKQYPKALQVFTTGGSVNSAGPSVSNFVLPERYLVDEDGQVLQLTGNVMGTNLFQLQMGEVVNTSESPEVTINKLTDSVYSLTSQSGSEKEETFVITTRDKCDETDIKRLNKFKPKQLDSDVNLLPVEVNEVEGDQQSALVLIVDANDVDK
ncbi:protein suppressor of hairy wing-like [Macrobrachium rosenbergii]|uniref:protein suppressor of hairy wing-like n=1 Tax=Macrobrachium rosenbergii TaxID=79674 RepID=UPI0034D774B6